MLRERCERACPCNAVGCEAARALKAAKGTFRLSVEKSVDRDELAAACEQELQHRDIPAECSATERPLAEERAAERAHCPPRRRPGFPVDMQADPVLEPADAASRRRSRNAVDRPEIEAIRPQRDLKTGDLRGDARGCRRRRKGEEQERGQAKDPPHGRCFSPRPPVSSR